MNRFGNNRRGGHSGGGFGGPKPPVEVGEELDVTIEAVGEKGDGIAKKDGFVLFIPGVKEGQHVKVRVTKVLRKVGFAEVIEELGSAPATSSKKHKEDEMQDEEQESEPEDSEDFGDEEPAAEEDAESTEDSENFGDEPQEDEEKY